MRYITNSQQETIDLGKKIAASFKPGDIVLLEGELGAGKTTLVKGIAQYFWIKKNITSPTFTLMNIYQLSSLPRIKYGVNHGLMKMGLQQESIAQLVHIDTYRLENEKDLLEIGVEDYLGAPDTICLIEWPEKIKTLTKNKKVTSIKITHKSNDERVIKKN